MYSKRGNVVGMLQVNDNDDILMITASEKIIRMAFRISMSLAAIPGVATAMVNRR
jgi:hypothetical protein